MTVAGLILIVALILFVLAAIGINAGRISLTPAGLALLTLYLLIGDGIL